MKKAVIAMLLIISSFMITVQAAASTSDPYYGYQENLKRIEFNYAWESGFDGRGVRIAIIDSGIYADHEDLASSNILQGVNVIDRSAQTNDTSGHGTFIAAMLASSKDNGSGIAGMVDRSSIVPLKCFASGRQTDARYIVSAIYMAVDEYNCDIINLSLGIAEDVPALRQATKYAIDRGVIIVASAGNTGGTALMYPAAYDNVVGVGSVNQSDSKSSFSQRNDSVYVVAPGEDIYSAGINSSTSYVQGSGTSFSSVHITALAAVAKQYDRSIDSVQFMKLLKGSATDLGTKGYDTTYGWGIVCVPDFIDNLLKYEVKFTDISGHWARGYIIRCSDLGVFSGVSDELFEPEGAMTRAMVATVLYRLDGSPTVKSSKSSFSDVPTGQWYSPAVQWAANNDIVSGVGDGSFLPEQNISRQELAVILHRYAQYKGCDLSYASKLQYEDATSIAAWARRAVNWCSYESIVSGRPDGCFDPTASASRAEVAAVLIRYINYIDAT